MVNRVLKAFTAGLASFLAALVAATSEASASWSSIGLNTWLVACGAALAAFTATYFVPNDPPAG